MTTLPDYITVNPDPPVCGQALSICYDPHGSGMSSIKLDITWDPPGEPTSVTINLNAEPPCTTITVPTTAKSVEITDPTHASAPYASSVLP